MENLKQFYVRTKRKPKHPFYTTEEFWKEYTIFRTKYFYEEKKNSLVMEKLILKGMDAIKNESETK